MKVILIAMCSLPCLASGPSDAIIPVQSYLLWVEQLKDASLKHLTSKTVFFLALSVGDCKF